MKPKFTFLALSAVCGLAATTIFVFESQGGFNKLAAAEPKSTYSIILNKDNAITADEKTAGTFERNTEVGNPVSFACNVADSYAPYGFFQTHGNGQAIWNTTAVTGLKTIKIKTNDDVANSRTYNILFGNAAGEYIYASDNITGDKTLQEYAVPQYETPFSFFKIQATNAGWTHFTSIELVYSCSSSIANRGDTFNGTDGGSHDFATALDVATETINVDIKWTDLGADNGKTAIAFFDEGWHNSFGYKTVTANSKTGAIPGLTVSKLSDGYTRFSWKLSEMTGTGTLPETIKTVHIRNNPSWTTSTGLFDVNSSAAVVEFKGNQFTDSGLNTDLSSSVSLETGKVQVDLYYTTYGTVAFAAMDDWNGNYYGYFNISPIGNNGSVYGVTVVSQSNGFVRLTVEASKISASKKNGTPTAINKIYLRGGWTTASGYVNVTVLAN